MLLSPGVKLGSYEIVSPLGQGGMGEVYRARDARLGRDVAIKILPSRLAVDPTTVARFEQEARAIAALSHPNILAIHDVGREGGVVFAVMELLDGRTLRETLDGSRLPLRKSVDYALQIAQGLAAAHAKGITHRDLKPENIFVTADGHVKILDFGLAKIDAGMLAASGADRTMTSAPVKTDAGTVLGTAGYLSPEQAQGKPTDARSDIFSFGAVLYEMATGARAFKGDSAIDTLHHIVHDPPAPIDAACPAAPGELKWLLSKCLAKDPDERYQSTRDLVVDLKNVARALESSANLPKVPSAPPTVASATARRWLMPAVVGLVLFMAAALLWLQPWRRPNGGSNSAEKLTIDRITTLGTVIDAVISPDGKYVAYIVSENALQGLWIRQLATSSSVQLVAPAPVGYWGANFSPDGSMIYYVIYTRDAPAHALYRIPAIGGTPRKLLTGIDSHPAFSPDGKQMAYMRLGFPEAGASSLMIADADGGNIHALVTKRPPEFLVPIFFTAAAWSPDGATIVAPVERRTHAVTGTLIAVRASDGGDAPFPHYEWTGMGQATWMPDGQGLVVVGGEISGGRRVDRLWYVSARAEERRKITTDLFDYRTNSVTADGSTLVSVGSESTASLWSAPIDGSGDPRRLSTGKYDGIDGLSVQPDGRILYRSVESGRPSVWRMNADGGSPTQLTTEGTTFMPAAMPDGRSLLFVREGAQSLWKLDLQKQSEEVVAGFPGVQDPIVSPDGQTIYFTSLATGLSRLWRMPASGGTPTQVLDGSAQHPSISPDGRQLAFYYQESPTTPWLLAVMPIDMKKPTLTFQVAPSASWATVRWTADGKALLHNSAPGDRANIWQQPLPEGAPRKLTRFGDQNVMDFDRSSDGKTLVIARGILSRDAVLIRNFR